MSDRTFQITASIHKAFTTSASNALPGDTSTEFFRVTASGDAAYIKFGITAPTATSADIYLPKDVPLIIRVPAEMNFIAALQLTTGGIIHVDALA